MGDVEMNELTMHAATEHVMNGHASDAPDGGDRA